MKLIPSNKILITLLFWDGDRNQAMKLARLLADLEPAHSNRADFLFVSRFDCAHDLKTIEYVSRKFNVFNHTSKRREVGWPLGCNGLFFGSMEYIYYRMTVGKLPNYKAVLILGADSAPLKRGGIEYLHQMWDDASAKKKIFAAGAMLPDVDPVRNNTHINGDCMLLSGRINFLKWLVYEVRDISVPAGWDWLLAKSFEKWGWANFPGVKSIWRKENFTEADWDHESNEGTVWFHGTKDHSLLELARKKLL